MTMYTFADTASAEFFLPLTGLTAENRDDSDIYTAIALGPDVRLDCETLECAAQSDTIRATLSPAALRAMEDARERFLKRRDCGDAIYGTTTGFGPFVRYASAQEGSERHGAGLIAHLSAGWGPLSPPEIVRATMLLRAQALAQGWSGVRARVVRAYLALLEAGLVPAVPEIGSVGASGDLIPLAHIARVLTGEGTVLCNGQAYPAADALRERGLEPLELEGRDALALTNGTSFLTAYAAFAVVRAERLISRAEALTGWAYRLLGCRASALDPRLHRARGHEGQRHSAATIAREARAQGAWEDASRPLQEIYSLRCAPQILGACRENLAFARRIIQTEMNGVSDNPLCAPDEADEPAAMLHGGNFHGQQVAFASDALNSALTQAALLAERQIEAILNPDINGGAPLLLAWQPGATSGMAGAQITATAIAAEMRTHNQAYATSTLPTNGGNQDIVSMGTLAARMAWQQTERLAPILAILGMSLAQLNFMRERGKAPGTAQPLPQWMPPFAGFEQDRSLRADIEHIASAWSRNERPLEK